MQEWRRGMSKQGKALSNNERMETSRRAGPRSSVKESVLSRELSGLPHWDMSTVFPSLESAEFVGAFEAAIAGIDTLGNLFDRHQVRRRESSVADAAFVQAYEEVTAQISALQEQMQVLGSYLGCFTATDARDDLARSLQSQL